MLRIGPSGNSVTFYSTGHKHTIVAPEWLHSIGLNAYEYSFGRGITLKEDTAKSIGEQAKIYDVQISVHAPYYINFANTSPDMIDKSIDYVERSVMFSKLFGGNRTVFHTATCGKMQRADAVALASDNLDKLLNRLESVFPQGDYIICPETMGKIQQIGTVEEVVEFCKKSEKMIPCFDFGHINSYTHGGIKGEDDYRRIIDYALDQLGERAKYLHIHFSKIMYGAGGEIKHLTFEDNVYGPEYEPLAKVIDEYQLSPVIICESRDVMSDDALKIKNCHKNT